ncbi:hypothetical protein Q4E93_28715 [Flavitalea sp. BT771]|uniref:hypothetical protein n=1 Tax=Flavitalea sp. BT771 TaxID=3063329 RepID=UPI0026E3FD47|nr:hypothetical protein [Flavitalea sp. BT771]MDO6434628.1 hypothetical protein [Flavitalea sp. BT771]MDV6223528.1 hypothetical protein [Flavitalea sp. BT771]
MFRFLLIIAHYDMPAFFQMKITYFVKTESKFGATTQYHPAFFELICFPERQFPSLKTIHMITWLQALLLALAVAVSQAKLNLWHYE